MSMPGVVYLLPHIHGKHALRYLYDKPPFHFLHAAELDLPQTVESVLATNDELSIVKVVEWGHLEVLEKGHVTGLGERRGKPFYFSSQQVWTLSGQRGVCRPSHS